MYKPVFFIIKVHGGELRGTMFLRTVCMTMLYLACDRCTETTKTAIMVHGFLFRDYFGGNNSIFFPRIRCFLAAARIQSDLGNFANYPKYFRNDSIMELAQTGIYQGEANIEEYVKFAFAGYSPYVACCNDRVKDTLKFIGYEKGQCKFVNFFTTTMKLLPNTTNSPLTPFQTVVGFKVYFDFERRYIKRVNVFYPEDFLRIFFDKFLFSNNTRRFICGVIDGPCSTILNTTDNIKLLANNDTCADLLTALPSSDERHYVDGKSQGCRTLHAAFAQTNPNTHCAHVSFAPQVDPSGNVKCQVSKNVLPSALFTDEELNIYTKFAKSVGLDPAIGHTYTAG
jgi:hypothetical protein